MAEPFGMIVPVYNEAALLPATVPMLLHGLPASVRPIYICNGCTDGSADLIRTLAGERATVLETPVASKALAIRLGELHAGGCFPRFFIDADLLIEGSALAHLADVLASGEADLVSPRLRFDTAASSPAVRAAFRAWQRTPYAREAFQGVLGVSAAGRAGWGAFPELICDDSFILSQIPPSRRRLVESAVAVARAPRTAAAFLGTLTRMEAGLIHLDALRLRPRSPGQRRALLAMVAAGPGRGDALAFLTFKLLARLRSRFGNRPRWYTDRTSRAPAEPAPGAG